MEKEEVFYFCISNVKKTFAEGLKYLKCWPKYVVFQCMEYLEILLASLITSGWNFVRLAFLQKEKKKKHWD